MTDWSGPVKRIIVMSAVQEKLSLTEHVTLYKQLVFRSSWKLTLVILARTWKARRSTLVAQQSLADFGQIGCDFVQKRPIYWCHTWPHSAQIALDGSVSGEALADWALALAAWGGSRHNRLLKHLLCNSFVILVSRISPGSPQIASGSLEAQLSSNFRVIAFVPQESASPVLRTTRQ